MTGRGENLNNSNREGNEDRENRKRHEQSADKTSGSRENDRIDDQVDGDEHDQIDTYRLMEAVDAALHASEEIAQYTGKPRPYPADLMGSALQPDMLAPFTYHEIEEASKFLLRMGEVSPSVRERKSTI
jgi:hypothetical protein